MAKTKFRKKIKGSRGRKAGPRDLQRRIMQAWQKIVVERNMRFLTLRRPRGPMPGAEYTCRQFCTTFNNQTGITNLGSGGAAGTLVANSTNAVTGFGFCIATEFADLSQVAQLAAVFDQYRIEKVLYKFKSRNNAISVQNTASPNGGVPTGYVVVDRDDSTVLTVNQAEQYDNCETFSGEDDFVVELIPSVTPAVFSSGAFTAYITEDSDQVWVDVANTNVPFYGIKGWITGLTVSTTSAWVWDVTACAVISFRNTR